MAFSVNPIVYTRLRYAVVANNTFSQINKNKTMCRESELIGKDQERNNDKEKLGGRGLSKTLHLPTAVFTFTMYFAHIQ